MAVRETRVTQNTGTEDGAVKKLLAFLVFLVFLIATVPTTVLADNNKTVERVSDFDFFKSLTDADYRSDGVYPYSGDQCIRMGDGENVGEGRCHFYRFYHAEIDVRMYFTSTTDKFKVVLSEDDDSSNTLAITFWLTEDANDDDSFHVS